MTDINFYKANAEEDYLTTPISVLRYISELEKERDVWISVNDKLPETNEHNESEYLLGYEKECRQQVVCWYNSRKDEWIVSHYKADNLPITITHWMPLLEPPKE